jgi:alpha-ketoglutarate-dependent 2,4-dichlorophenoxyacetate dioxygenase
MPLELQPLHPLFAAAASGIDLHRPLAPEDARAIEAAMDRYAVLVFHSQQRLAEDEQIRFASNFGRLDLGLKKARRIATATGTRDEIIEISNVDPGGKVFARDHAKIYSNVANQLWHSDSSFQKPATKYSMLSALVVPDKGGQTEFTDLRAGYDALAEDMKRELEGLRAEHFAFHSRLALGDDSFTAEQLATFPRVEWPLVRTHPGSGRKVLFVGSHCTHIPGMTLPEGRMLLADLLEHATRREFVYRHEWRVGDLVMWDNRATLHRGRRFDLSVPRELRRTTTLDEDSA